MHIPEFLQFLSSEKRYSPHTISAYKTDLVQFYKFIDESYSVYTISDVSHQMIRSWIMTLLDADISARTVNRKLSALKTYYRYLRKERIVDTNPMIKILPPKTNKPLPEFVTIEQMSLLFDHSIFDMDYEGIRDKLILELFYFTGIRLAELINLKNSDIDFIQNHIKVLGKRNKERIIPFGSVLDKSFKKYIDIRDATFGTKANTQSFFLTKKGLKVYEKLVYRSVNMYLSKVSTLKKKSPHILRHTFATHMLNNGADLNAIKEILGHANLSATQVYTHNSIEKLKSIYNQAHPRA